MVQGCKKEQEDQCNVNIGGIATGVDAFLEHFETYKKLDVIKQATAPIPRKPFAGHSSGNGTKNSGGSSGDDNGNKKQETGKIC